VTKQAFTILSLLWPSEPIVKALNITLLYIIIHTPKTLNSHFCSDCVCV